MALFHVKETQTFQFTTSQGGRLYTNRLSFCASPFQFTTSQGGRRISSATVFMAPFFQFTTSQGGRPYFFEILHQILVLSIHDLTRRSTEDGTAIHVQYILSIHDLTRRSTQQSAFPYFYGCFQFTTSQGGRRTDLLRSRCTESFNSRPHKEVDSKFA